MTRTRMRVKMTRSPSGAGSRESLQPLSPPGFDAAMLGERLQERRSTSLFRRWIPYPGPGEDECRVAPRASRVAALAGLRRS